MIFPDVNLLLYAHDESSDFHRPSAAWLKSVLLSEQVFFSWQTITGFLRIITHPRLSSKPLSIVQAVEIVDSWLASDNAHLVTFEKKSWNLFSSILIDSQANGNLVMDAHVAAMAASCGATVATTDRDFSRFSDVRLVNPLQP
jgi:toxin-antitoxin system PIN domain toxin